LITSLLRDEARKTGTISLKNFYLRRVLRIFPPCYLTVIIVTTLAAMGIRVQPGKLRVAGFGVSIFLKLLEHSGMGKSAGGFADPVVSGRRGALLPSVSSSVRLVRSTLDC